MDNQSIQHIRWNCMYHIISIPKYRKKMLYGGNKKDIVEIIKKWCEMKNVQLIGGKLCVDHIHMYVAIPAKMSVSEFMSYLKGKSALMFFDKHPEFCTKWGDHHLWARGYYVATVGNVNEEAIRNYIREQEESDKLEDAQYKKSLQGRLLELILVAIPPLAGPVSYPKGLKINPHLKWGLLTSVWIIGCIASAAFSQTPKVMNRQQRSFWKNCTL